MKCAGYRLTKLTTVFSAQAADTVSAHVRTKHYDFVVVQVATAALTDGTFKVRGSVDSAADLTAAQSVSNIWDHKYMYNLDSGAGVPGSTGVALGASAYAEFKVNTDTCYNISLEITGRTAGSYTAKVFGVNFRGT